VPRKHLTEPFIERLMSPRSGQLDIFDHGYPGLSLRVPRRGHKA